MTTAAASRQKNLTRVAENMLTTKRGLTLLELIVCTLIIGILSTTAVPIAKNVVRKQKESLLRDHLKEMRKAIDRYYEKKSAASPGLEDAQYYPQSLEELVEGRYLRRIPLDPFTEKPDWKTRSSTDAPGNAISNQQNVFDIYSATSDSDLRGQLYSTW
ncbi:MAG TPA: general secretion pathway protein GspG [Candidatus Riflebacteria bacterium]|nr:general secretion pathway protein GspG [Candidatus Riflebacteria bacterium]